MLRRTGSNVPRGGLVRLGDVRPSTRSSGRTHSWGEERGTGYEAQVTRQMTWDASPHAGGARPKAASNREPGTGRPDLPARQPAAPGSGNGRLNPVETMCRLLHPRSIVVLSDHDRQPWRERMIHGLESSEVGDRMLALADPRLIPPGTDLVLVAVATTGLLTTAVACATAGVSVMVVCEPTQVALGLMHAVVERARQGSVRVLGPGVRTLVSASTGPSGQVGARAVPPLRGGTAVVGSGRTLGSALGVLREAGEPISAVIDVGGGADLGLTDAAAAALHEEGTALVIVAAPPQAPRAWDEVAAVARHQHKLVVAVGRRRRPAFNVPVVQVARRDLAATVGFLRSTQASGHGDGVLVVGTESAAPLRAMLSARGVCRGILTQQAELRLQHLHLETLVGDAPPSDADQNALVTAAATASECPDVGVVVMPLPRPQTATDRRRLLAILDGLADAGTNAPVVAIVAGGLAGAPLPVFQDHFACVDVLQFAHAHGRATLSSAVLGEGD